MITAMTFLLFLLVVFVLMGTDTVRRMWRDGSGPRFVTIRRSVKYSQSAVEAFIAANTHGRSAPRKVKRRPLVEARS